MLEKQIDLINLDTTTVLGQQLANILKGGDIIFLCGDLGAGKTTLSRAILRGLGHTGTVKSPTYNLLESYVLEKLTVHHFDLYRLADAEELEYIGIDDYFDANTLCMMEWPERGAGFLPQEDVIVTLCADKFVRTAILKAVTERGRAIVELISLTV